MIDRIPLRDVRGKYNSTRQIWNEADYWHFHLHNRYKKIINSISGDISRGSVLNIGSAKENYQLSKSSMIYLDAAEKSLPRDEMAVCADAHRMPFRSGYFQSAIAIGSVINYCAPADLFSEVARVLTEEGLFIFDFEQSEAAEHFGSSAFGKRAYLFKTDFNDIDETIWVFKAGYISNLLQLSGFRICKIINIHTISSIIWRFTENNRLTAASCKLDRAFSMMPFLKNYSSSIFVIARKTASRSV